MEIKSPEMAEDQNTFLLWFNDLDLHASENETLRHLKNDTKTLGSIMTMQTRASTRSSQALEDSGPVNISVKTILTLDPLKLFWRVLSWHHSSVFNHFRSSDWTLRQRSPRRDKYYLYSACNLNIR